MKRQSFALAVLLCAATGALAHQGVKNAAVKARMDAMSAIGKDMKVLGSMAKGKVPFDAESAQIAVASIADHAAMTTRLFEEKETDHKSEAKPEIWEDFGDFSRKAGELADVATGLSGKINRTEDLGRAITSLGATCKSCHEIYREGRH
jgi:cytochrome c556